MPLHKRRWFRVVVELGLVGLLVFVGLRLWQQHGAAASPTPVLHGTAVLGQAPIDLNDYHGAPVMVHFWASWCGVCRGEQHKIVTLAKNYPVLTVATLSGNADEVAAYLKKHPIDAPTLVDPKAVAARIFGVHTYPTTFVLDGDGNVRHVEVGYASELGLRIHMWLAKL